MSELDFLLKKKKKSEDAEKSVNINESVKKEESLHEEEKIKNEMLKFIERDPKIGVWSYPAFLVLQYLYHTVPGFKMSRTAKEALEKGLKEMYPILFDVAEKIAKEKFKE
ncbi:conserved hypothetical protein [Sulfolobus islandicus Y.G.57.14]|jgi:hypothetical protein|uniref:Uncharacterized protein n=3 Tax=Saccharolobus islandicus TaxID=43080 RepID=C3N8V3_SACI7|nr:hypothetical protein [Sulfolobus islandicus]ACP46458.1 conserved hypothetical protein [Sulfolobus islandicus Y.G.57.14]ACP47836.1 conserved hypothetical protein [Sulfolobus islandicus Y.N.15.51]ADB87992.1 conserved hypothetical protein [Sulfolobus islandicus L.D.8.5]PVU77491.1 hypothetical protein DDW12_06700 [Sulfolobus islandicus]